MALKAARIVTANLRAGEGPEGANLDADQPDLLPERRGNRRAGDALSRAGAEHSGEDPGDRAGIAAIEEATSRGVNVNATVCFTLPQSIAVAEAVERGLKRQGGGGPRHRGHDAGLHPHDRAAG